jgi:hypothetical protein
MCVKPLAAVNVPHVVAVVDALVKPSNLTALVAEPPTEEEPAYLCVCEFREDNIGV